MQPYTKFFIYNIYTIQIHHNDSYHNYKETYKNTNGLVPLVIV